MAIIRLTNIDSTMPNLALMKLAHYHKSLDDEVHFYNSVRKDLFEPEYDIVYGSSIFSYTQNRRNTFITNFPNAILGGTGDMANLQTIEHVIGQSEYEYYDYSIYPDYKWSIGYTQRGCRFKCKFCVVPQKEGNNKEIQTIHDIWRDGTEKRIHLIDNDFFGQTHWKDRCKEIIDNQFSICLDQGINFRILSDEQIEYLVNIDMRNKKFKNKVIYTAWDKLSHEKIFMEGLKRVRKAGYKSTIFCYILIGFQIETDEQITYRISKAIAEGNIYVYPMVYQNRDNPDYKRLNLIRSWVITKAAYANVSLDDFLIKQKRSKKRIKYIPVNQLSFEDI